MRRRLLLVRRELANDEAFYEGIGTILSVKYVSTGETITNRSYRVYLKKLGLSIVFFTRYLLFMRARKAFKITATSTTSCRIAPYSGGILP